MIKVSSGAIADAFEAYVRHYAISRGWTVSHQLDLYATASRAFASPGSLDDFRRLHGYLKSGWQVF